MVLMLPTLIQRYDQKEKNKNKKKKQQKKKKKTTTKNKKKNSFFIQFKNERLFVFYRPPDATFYDRINTIYQFIKPFLDKKNVYF